VPEQDWVRATQAQFTRCGSPTGCGSFHRGVTRSIPPPSISRSIRARVRDRVASEHAPLPSLAARANCAPASRFSTSDAARESWRSPPAGWAPVASSARTSIRKRSAASRANAARNGVDATFLPVARLSAMEAFDVVVANILANPLMSLAPRSRAMCGRGRIVLSGILDAQAAPS
jgi:hypothetical protein